MLVETYEVTETNPETGTAEFEPEALALIEELGLEGQQSIISRREAANGEGDVATLCPYAEMDATTHRVYQALLPDSMKLGDYDRGPIPLRVLQVAALAERESWFDKLQVWCSPSSADKDPLLVGIRSKPGTYGQETRLFLLARWGEVLQPFEELVELARDRWVAKRKAELEERIADAQTKLASIGALAVKHFAGEWVNV